MNAVCVPDGYDGEGHKTPSLARGRVGMGCRHRGLIVTQEFCCHAG